MGNNNIKGDIYIQTDSSIYQPGDTVTGKVYLNLKMPFESKNLFLKVKGYEQTKWVDAVQRRAQKKGPCGEDFMGIITNYEKYQDRRYLFSHKFTLHTFQANEIVQPGHYVFPFQFRLDDNLPGSYSERGKDPESYCDYSASIRYKVKAEMVGLNQEKLSNMQEFILKQRSNDFKKRSWVEKIIKPTTWGCFSGGQSTVKCKLEDNCETGKIASLQISLDNSQSEIDIQDLEIQLQKTLILKAKKGDKFQTRVIKTIVQTSQQEGIKAKLKAIDSDQKIIELFLYDDNNIPIQPSTKGNLVSCTYNVIVSPNLLGCSFFQTEPCIFLSLQIHPIPSKEYGTVTAPSNWKPLVFEIKPIAFSDEFKYNDRHSKYHQNSELLSTYNSSGNHPFINSVYMS